jgi:hypothetical protein
MCVAPLISAASTKAAASTPGFVVELVVFRLKNWGCADIREVKWTEKDARFALPSELQAVNTTYSENLSTS